MFIVPSKKARGFTLLEILVALFIFSILSLMLAGGLRSVINASSSTETKAESLRSLQLALLMISRDVEQTVNRPITNASGREEPAFIGTHSSFTFTHTGLANPEGKFVRSSLQRTRYSWDDKKIWRSNWDVLDQAPQSKPSSRPLLDNVLDVRFQYLDHENEFHSEWPFEGGDKRLLPKAVSIHFTLAEWGDVSQIYMIPVPPIQNTTHEEKKPEKIPEKH